MSISCVRRSARANDAAANRRQKLDERAHELLDERMNPICLDAAEIVQRSVHELGFDNYLELYRKILPPSALDELAAQCRSVLDSTERLWEAAADQLFRSRVGVGLGEAARWDV